jgi:hypothetical protein
MSSVDPVLHMMQRSSSLFPTREHCFGVQPLTDMSHTKNFILGVHCDPQISLRTGCACMRS